MPDKNKRVKFAPILILAAIAFSGCRTAHKVAVTSFRVIDAPASYVRRQLDGSETTTTTTTTVESDAVTPGRPVNVAPTTRDSQRRRVTQDVTASSSAERSKPSPPPSQRNVPAQTGQLPTARPVPGKPGYVFSPFDPSGGYVDVTGYTPGQKVKDPYSGKIFLVP